MPINSTDRIVPNKLFYRNGATKSQNEMPYILLYADITKLR